jgi:hypothetical protein
MTWECNEQNFLKDVAEHQMLVIRDEGLNRHLRFKKPDTYCMHFDLITWPGHLCYTGDMGTYVFTRIEDMFQFFRRAGKEKKYAIDRRYWAEKCISLDRSGIEEFDEDKFKQIIFGRLVEWIKENRYRTTKEERRDLWDDVVNQVSGAEGDGGGYRLQIAAYDFSHTVNSEIGEFYFSDLFESNFNRYTTRFTWCCFAMAWAIEQYDLHKEAVPA